MNLYINAYHLYKSQKAYLLDFAVITTNALEVNMLNHAKIQNADVQNFD